MASERDEITTSLGGLRREVGLLTAAMGQMIGTLEAQGCTQCDTGLWQVFWTTITPNGAGGLAKDRLEF